MMQTLHRRFTCNLMIDDIFVSSPDMKSAIDLYSGIGGWTLGMKLSGITNLASYEWWSEANQTHNANFDTTHKEVDIRKIDVKKDLDFLKNVDFVVGSPPCTQFSFANRGGNGDIQDGLVDIYKFLEVVDFLKPKFWAMENVPRVARILEKEIKDGALQRFKPLVKHIIIVDSAEYGIPQNRKRMIAGNFPLNLFESYKTKTKKLTFGNVLDALRKDIVIDPNFGYKIALSEITELENEADLTQEEARINKDSKTYHPVYNKMSFPDKLDRPSRTITATCTRVSRESIVVQSKTGFRRLNVRERGVLQGFPITYQFYGRTLNSKFKMIGNAVPPILTYYLFQSMLQVQLKDLRLPAEVDYYHHKPSYTPYKSNLGLPARKYPLSRKFQFSVPHLRFGSGVRFELSNDPKSESKQWSFKFFHGNSKNIKQVKLNNEINEALAPLVNTSTNTLFTEYVNKLADIYRDYNSQRLQDMWTSSKSNYEVFSFLDEVGECVSILHTKTNLKHLGDDLIESILKEKNKKLTDNKDSLLIGFYFLSSLNHKILNR